MSSTGLLILSNVNNIKSSLVAAQKYVKNLYIHINIPKTSEISSLPSPAWRHLVNRIYADCFRASPNIDVRVLATPLKNCENSLIQKEIQMLFSDINYPEICERFKNLYKIDGQAIILNDTSETYFGNFRKDDSKMFGTVVVGGTFDRIHTGHKILLTEAILRARNKLIVGVTSNEMVKSKKLHELILPVEQRIRDVENFLTEIDASLEYNVVAIHDAYGPTRDDPNIDLIIVSTETLRGGHKINEARVEQGLRPLVIECIDLIELENETEFKEAKISSSNTRMDLLGTRIKNPEPRPNLPRIPYIIGLTGGIASGKSKMAERFEKMGATLLDCDKIAHEIYEPGRTCFLKIVDHFGLQVIGDNKEIDRKALGSIVFGDKKELDVLNAIIWPELILEVKRRIKSLSYDPTVKVVVLEAAVLFQAGWETECHEVWTMIVSVKEAIDRVMNRNNLSEDEARKRISSQLDNATMISKANIVFSSEWSCDFTENQAFKAWNIVLNEVS